MKKSKSMYGEFDTEEELLEYIVDENEIYECEGLEEVYFLFMALPIEKRTAKELDAICQNITEVDFDQNDPPDWLHRV